MREGRSTHLDLEERSPTSSNRDSTCQPLCLFERIKGKDEGKGKRHVPGCHPTLRDKERGSHAPVSPSQRTNPSRPKREGEKDALNALNGRQSVRLELGQILGVDALSPRPNQQKRNPSF